MFNGRLKNLRNSKKISQAEFARAIGVAQQTVGEWEKNYSFPNYEILNKIANYFDVTTDYLLGRETPKALTLSHEQTAVLDGFDSLNESGRNALPIVLNGLRAAYPARAAM